MISCLYSEILPCINPCLLITASVLAKAKVQVVHSVLNGFQIFFVSLGYGFIFFSYFQVF